MSCALAGLVADTGGPGTGRFLPGVFFSTFFTGPGLADGALGRGPGFAVTPVFFAGAAAAVSSAFSGLEPEGAAAN